MEVAFVEQVYLYLGYYVSWALQRGAVIRPTLTNSPIFPNHLQGLS